MLRTTMTIASLLVLMLVCGSLAGQVRQPKEQERALPTITVDAEDEVAARNVARREAVKHITALMESQRPQLVSFKVDEKYVEENRVLNNPLEGRVKAKIVLDGKERVFKEWELTFRTDADWWAEIVRRDHAAQREARHLRAQERETVTARVMLGLAILLLAGFGYVRLDEYTQRRHTAWLRVAGVGVAASVVAVWLWMFQA